MCDGGWAWAVFPALKSERSPITTLCCNLLCEGMQPLQELVLDELVMCSWLESEELVKGSLASVLHSSTGGTTCLFAEL